MFQRGLEAAEHVAKQRLARLELFGVPTRIIIIGPLSRELPETRKRTKCALQLVDINFETSARDVVEYGPLLFGFNEKLC